MSESLGKLHFWPSLIFMNGILCQCLFKALQVYQEDIDDGGQSYAHASDILQWNEFMTISAFCLGCSNTICFEYHHFFVR